MDFGNELECILKMHGIDDVNEFLNPTIKNIESPLLFDNIIRAVDMLVKHIKRNSIISIAVDCDADGYTSASLLYQYLKRIKPDIQIEYIIHHEKERGINDMLNSIIECKSKLLIVPDAGTNDVAEIYYLKSVGIDCIVLDHHICTEKDPSSPQYHACVVNNQMSAKVTDKEMTGVGIAYKFCKQLDSHFGVNYADDYIDLVCVGMIADRCGMCNLQSRYLILEGLKQISDQIGKNIFIKALVQAQEYSLGNEVTVSGVGFYIAPLINSLIRFGSYEDKCLMFEAFCNSNKTLMRVVRGQGEIELPIQEYVLKSCESCNRTQKKEVEKSTAILTEDIESHNLHKYPVIVCNALDAVDKNSTGLIANKLASTYKKPCLVLRRYGNICSGSARGFDKCEISDFNAWCKATKLFKSVSGHDNAFGASITFENTNKLFGLLSTMPASSDIIYRVYNVYNSNSLSDTIVKNIGKYHYVWGGTIEEPLFMVEDIVCSKYNVNLIGLKQNRLQFKWHNIEFTMFSKGGSLAKLYKEILDTGENIKFTVVGKFKINTFNGAKVPQVMIEDLSFEKSDIQVGFGF